MPYPVITVDLPSELVGVTNGQLAPSLLVKEPGLNGGPLVRLTANAMRCFRAMRAKALRDGVILNTTSLYDSYRPYEIQERIFLQRYQLDEIPGAKRKWWRNSWWYLKPIPGNATAAVPGTSNHGLGLALDFADTTGARRAWLLKNAVAFGFSWEDQSEAWHLRYVRGDRIPAVVLEEEEHMPTAQEIATAILDTRIPGTADKAGEGFHNLDRTLREVFGDVFSAIKQGRTAGGGANSSFLDEALRNLADDLAVLLNNQGLDPGVVAQIKEAARQGAESGSSGASPDEVRAVVDDELDKHFQAGATP